MPGGKQNKRQKRGHPANDRTPVSSIYIHVHVQYAAKKTFHTVVAAHRLYGTDQTVVRPFVISTVQRSFQRCNGRTQYERCFTENNGGVTILASALSLDQLSSARVSASWQRLREQRGAGTVGERQFAEGGPSGLVSATRSSSGS